jgi:ABC-type spermidine/putrescine transport system permease subunit I
MLSVGEVKLHRPPPQKKKAVFQRKYTDATECVLLLRTISRIALITVTICIVFAIAIFSSCWRSSQTGASHLFVLVVCCTMLVALILVTYTFTIQNAGRTQEILFVLLKGMFGGHVSAMWGDETRRIRAFPWGGG